jgi:hypothetical protein
MKTKLTWLFIWFLLFGACQTSKNINSYPNDTKTLYQQSIFSAMSPGPDKVYENLVAIDHPNENQVWKNIGGVNYILVVAWKKDASFYKTDTISGFYNTGKYQIWVTTAPELLQRMKNEKYDDVNLRLKQLLGLPPNSVYNYFIEFWVRPEDLFRPCPDSEIADKKCDLCFPENTDSSYISWINDNRIGRYYQCEPYGNYPWTQLGYTYDWNAKNKTHVGLSEFVIGQDRNIIINGIYSTEDYLKKNIDDR